MRNAALVIVFLVLSGLVPVGGWLLMLSNLDPAGLGRSIGKAILLLLSPAAIAGLLMIAGAAMIGVAPRGAAIVATVGASLALVSGLVIAVFLTRRYANCGGAGCREEFMAMAAAFGYAFAQAGLIALIWRARSAAIALPG